MAPAQTCEGIPNFNLPSFCSPWKTPQPETPSTSHYHLPALSPVASQIQSSAFRSISAHVLANLINTLSHEEFTAKYCLVDCRYPYEYCGGHIKHATNLFDPEEINQMFYPDDEEEAFKMRQKIPIFYCEFSQKRGPQMGHKLREIDRMRNEHSYPQVDFPEIYLLDRGYSNFFSQCGSPVLCQPMEYVKMLDKRHRANLHHFSFHHSRSSIYRSSSHGDSRRDMKRRRASGSSESSQDSATTPVGRARILYRETKNAKIARKLFYVS